MVTPEPRAMVRTGRHWIVPRAAVEIATDWDEEERMDRWLGWVAADQSGLLPVWVRVLPSPLRTEMEDEAEGGGAPLRIDRRHHGAFVWVKPGLRLIGSPGRDDGADVHYLAVNEDAWGTDGVVDASGEERTLVMADAMRGVKIRGARSTDGATPAGSPPDVVAPTSNPEAEPVPMTRPGHLDGPVLTGCGHPVPSEGVWCPVCATHRKVAGVGPVAIVDVIDRVRARMGDASMSGGDVYSMLKEEFGV